MSTSAAADHGGPGQGAPGHGRTLLVVSTPDEVLLAAAADRAGALRLAATTTVVTGSPRSTGGGAVRWATGHLLPHADVTTTSALAGGPGADDTPHLVVGTQALAAGRALLERHPSARVTVLAAGAAAYGPTPEGLSGRMARRTDAVVHLGLLTQPPLLLSERGTPARAVPPASLASATARLPAAPDPAPGPTTLVLARTASWPAPRPGHQHADLLAAMVSRCVEAGHSRLVVLLDPDAPQDLRRRLAQEAHALRADVTVVDDAGPAGRWTSRPGVSLVVGCASEDLLLARAVWGRRVAELDTDRLLKRLDPFEDPRRTAAALVLATVPDLRSWTASPDGEDRGPVDVAGLLVTVAYAMQPDLLASHRGAAIAFTTSHPGTRRRYVRRRRLSELRLPGGRHKVRAVLDPR